MLWELKQDLLSLDLSAAFDMVNIDLLLKRMSIMGLPDDLIGLISIWLKERTYFVSLNGKNSTLYNIFLGTFQGSVLGPVLYAIYISPIFDLEDLSAFADNNYAIQINSDIPYVLLHTLFVTSRPSCLAWKGEEHRIQK